MSRLNKTIDNPAERFFRWDAIKGDIYYWDKEAEKEVHLDLPFHFLMLDILSTIRGFHQPSESRIWSNDIRNFSEILTVKAFDGGVIAQGKYDDIKHKIKSSGGKFANSVYIAYNEDGEMKIGNLCFKGSALSAWIDLQNKVGQRTLEEKATVITGSQHETNGNTEYEVPVFKVRDVKPEADQQAIELNKKLEEYLDSRNMNVDVPIEEKDEQDDNFDGMPSAQPQPEANGREHAEAMHGPPQGGPHPAEINAGRVDMSDDLDDMDDNLPF